VPENFFEHSEQSAHSPSRMLPGVVQSDTIQGLPAHRCCRQSLQGWCSNMSVNSEQLKSGQILVVTGGSRGIGAAVSRLAGRRGYTVIVNYARDGGAAQAVVDEIVQAGGHASPVQADVSREADVMRLFEAADRLGPLAGLVNNGGIAGGMCRVDSVSAQTLETVLAVNVVGPFLCAREAVRRMSTRHGGHGGVIVNMSSQAARIGGGGEWVHYAASKAAIDTMTIGLAREVADEGIRVNAVSPGLIETELHAANGSADRLARLAPAIPMKRAGSAEEVAENVLWLLSPGSSYVTGAIIPVSGGR
jgi:NAD(P)-dependent dehydrogenase (short-subunit alcohol dehydrogenase family)